MLRRNARLRKEFLYRKSLEGKEKVAYERKLLIKKALAGTINLLQLCFFSSFLSFLLLENKSPSFSLALTSLFQNPIHRGKEDTR